MLYLLDSNAFSDLMSERPRFAARFNAIGPSDQVFISATVRGEILSGILRLPRGARRQSLEARADWLFHLIPCEAVSSRTADQYAIIKTNVESKGTPVAESDLWIAAAAMDLGAILVTRDRVFHRVSDLTVEDWTA